MHVEFVKIIFWGYAQTITVLLKGGGVSRDPQKFIRNLCTAPMTSIIDIGHSSQLF